MAAKHSHGPNFGRHVEDCPRCIELANGAPVIDSYNRRPSTAPVTTKHTCSGPVFGRLTDGCPRCDEVKAGAEPIRWAPSRREQDAQLAAEIRAHDCKTAGCSIICTFGQW